MCHKINIKYDIKTYPKKEIKDDIEIDTKIYSRPVRKHGRFWRRMIREGRKFFPLLAFYSFVSIIVKMSFFSFDKITHSSS